MVVLCVLCSPDANPQLCCAAGAFVPRGCGGNGIWALLPLGRAPPCVGTGVGAGGAGAAGSIPWEHRAGTSRFVTARQPLDLAAQGQPLTAAGEKG